LGVVGFAPRRPGSEELRMEVDVEGQVFDVGIDVEVLHGISLSAGQVGDGWRARLLQVQATGYDRR
jgi:hypothetical protein